MQENTFQVALASDGNSTFLFIIYGDIEWGRYSGIGFKNAGGSLIYQLPGSLTYSSIDINNYSNVGKPGLFIYQVDGKVLSNHLQFFFDKNNNYYVIIITLKD